MRKSSADNIKIYLLVTVLGISLLFSAFGKTANISDRMLVHAMGIDPSEDGGYKVSMQIFKSSGAGSDTPIDPSQPNVEVISGEGKTITEAIKKASYKTGREAFLGHLQLICFNRDIDFSDPEDLFRFTLADKNVYLGVDLCLSETTAEDIMNAKMTRGATSAEALKKIIDTNAENSTAIKCEMLDFLSCVNTPQHIAMPVLSVEEQSEGGEGGSSGQQAEQQGGQQQGQQQEQQGSSEQQEGQGSSEPQVSVSSTALIKEGKVLEDTLDSDEAQGVAWLTRRAERGDMIVKHSGELINVMLTRDKIKTDLKIKDGRISYKADITVVAHANKNLRSSAESEELSREIADELQRIFKAAEDKALRKNGTDIVGIWRLLRHEYPRTYIRYRDSLDSIYGSVDFETNVKVRVE